MTIYAVLFFLGIALLAYHRNKGFKAKEHSYNKTQRYNKLVELEEKEETNLLIQEYNSLLATSYSACSSEAERTTLRLAELVKELKTRGVISTDPNLPPHSGFIQYI